MVWAADVEFMGSHYYFIISTHGINVFCELKYVLWSIVKDNKEKFLIGL